MVREDLLDLVMTGAWRSSSERRVMKYESRRSVRVTGGFVMSGVEFRSHMIEKVRSDVGISFRVLG